MRRSLLLLSLLLALMCVTLSAGRSPVIHQPKPKLMPVSKAMMRPADVPPATGKVFVHQKGIDLIQNMVNAILEADLKNVALPDQTLKFAGGHVDLTNTVLQNVQFTAQQVGLVAPNQITIDFTNFQGELDLDWAYHGPLGIHFHGTGTNKFSETSISTVFTCTSDSTGRPQITLDTLDVKIDDLDIHLTGGGAWLFNFLIKLFKGPLIHTLQSKISDVATTDFNNILTAIEQKYPLVMPLKGSLLNTTQVDLELVPSSSVAVGDNPPSAFSIAGDYLVVAGEWSFQSTINTTVDARQHDEIPDSMPTNPSGTLPMFGVAFDEYFSGSLLYSLMQNGKFSGYIDNSNLPPSSIIRLNTHLIATEYPALYAQFPNNNISLTITPYAGQPPLATTSPTGTHWSDAASVMINVIDPTQPDPIVPICELMVQFNLTSNFNFVVNSTGVAEGVEFFVGSLTPFEFEVEVVWARIDPGTFASSVQGFVTTIVDDVLLPLINASLNNGVAIPLSIGAVAIQNLFLSYGNHVLSLGFDLNLSAGHEWSEWAAYLLDWERS